VGSLSDDFSAVFVRVVASALRIPAERVTIVGITAGSVIVEFSLDINESEIASLRGSVQATIFATGHIGEYTLVSVSTIHDAETPVAPMTDDGQNNAGQPIIATVAFGLVATVLLMMILWKVCCKKKVKGEFGELSEWN
jgi:hypothetical protein